MKIFSKTKKILGEKRIKKYQLLGLTLLKKEKTPSLYKIKIFNINVFSKSRSETRKKYFIFGIKVFQKNRHIKKEYEKFIIPSKITFMKEKTPLVSIIIPVYNQIEYTKQCLCSILKYGYDVSYEIIIADDNSSDETRNLSNFAENITIIRNDKNLGYIKNCNNAAKYAKGKYLYFLNNDTIVQEKWLSELLRVFELRKDAGVVGSKILRPDGTLQECGVFTFNDLIYADYSKDPSLEQYNYLKKCDYVSGCSLLTPTWMFQKIGGFDEIFSPAYCDDPDYCFSVNALGYSVYAQPSSQMFYFGSVSYDKKSSDLQIRNNKILREKWSAYFAQKTDFNVTKLPFSNKLRPKTILVVDDLYPQFDKHAGGKTIFQYLQLFERMGLNVKFCPLFAKNRELPYSSILSDMGIEIISPCNIHTWIESHKHFLDYIFLSRPNVIESFMTKSLMSQGIKVFYYGHDLHHIRMQREEVICRTDNHTEIERMKELELAAVSSVTCAFYPSFEEKKYLNNILPNATINVIPPYLYDTVQMKNKKSFGDRKGILFVGSSHGPNRDGLSWFINEVFPLVIKELPDLVLYVAGSHIDKTITRESSSNIKILGFVPEENLDVLYSSVRLTIAPLRYGAGIKGKVVDAIYHGVPVITTTIGAEGLPKSEWISVADDAKLFADKLITQYTNEFPSLESGIKFIEDNFSYSKAYKAFSSFIDNEFRLNS